MDKLEKALEKARAARQRVASAGQTETRDPVKDAKAGRFEGGRSTVVLSEALLEHNRIVSFQTRSPEADTFRLLRAQVLQTMTEKKMKTLAITSANYGEGKTTLAVNLALSIAMDQKQTVLLADMDLRKPNVPGFLGIQTSCGVTDCVAGTAKLEECLIRLPFERMSVLPAGTMTQTSSETLGSPRMGALAEEMRHRYDDRLIIYDMPPLLAQDDPLAFLPHVDAVLLVVRNGVTRSAEVTRCLEILDKAVVIGTVLNDVV